MTAICPPPWKRLTCPRTPTQGGMTLRPQAASQRSLDKHSRGGAALEAKARKPQNPRSPPLTPHPSPCAKDSQNILTCLGRCHTSKMLTQGPWSGTERASLHLAETIITLQFGRIFSKALCIPVLCFTSWPSEVGIRCPRNKGGGRQVT